MATTIDTTALDNNDKFNIYSAYETDQTDEFFTLWHQRPRNGGISEFFSFLCKRANLDKYITAYQALPVGEQRDGFWLQFRH